MDCPAAPAGSPSFTTLLFSDIEMSDAVSEEQIYCYHCQTRHPKSEMRQVENKGVKRWRCIKSIEATKQSRAAREAFGRQVTANNKSEARDKAKKFLNADR